MAAAGQVQAPGNTAADPLEQAGAGPVVSGEAARDCPRWPRQARYGPGNSAADPLEGAGAGPVVSREAARTVTVGHVTPGERRGRPPRACS